jgi:hypothetical protein
MTSIRVFQIASYPCFDIADLWEGVTYNLTACIELRETHTEGEIIDISIMNRILRRSKNRWVNKEAQESFACKCPALGITTRSQSSKQYVEELLLNPYRVTNASASARDLVRETTAVFLS